MATPPQKSFIDSKNVDFGHAVGDFEATVILKLGPKDDASADALYFFMVPKDQAFPGSRPFFAVVFDIFQSNQGSIKLGINIDSMTPINSIPISNMFMGKEVTLKVSYVAATGKITASATYDSDTHAVSHVQILSKNLPAQVTVGLASSTGKYVIAQDIVSWDFKN